MKTDGLTNLEDSLAVEKIVASALDHVFPVGSSTGMPALDAAVHASKHYTNELCRDIEHFDLDW